MRIKRLYTFYTRVLLWPNIALHSLSSLMFFLPGESLDKINFGMTVLLTLCVNLMIMTDFIPTSRYFPRVGNYFLLSICQSIFGIVVVCIIGHTKLHNSLEENVESASEDDFSHTEGSSTSAVEKTESPEIETQGHSWEKMKSFKTKFLNCLIKYQPALGLIYLIATIVAHIWCYSGYTNE